MHPKKRRTQNPAPRRKPRFARGQTPAESEREVESTPKREIVFQQVLDDPADPSITPVVPRCRKCGHTFSTEAELLDHVKTCKGNHDAAVRPHTR